jgi:hypothetical protein
VFLLLALVFALWRWRGLRLSDAFACLLLGFELASTGAASSINQIVNDLVKLLSTL